jgi:hypothetical protein
VALLSCRFLLEALQALTSGGVGTKETDRVRFLMFLGLGCIRKLSNNLAFQKHFRHTLGISKSISSIFGFNSGVPGTLVLESSAVGSAFKSPAAAPLAIAADDSAVSPLLAAPFCKAPVAAPTAGPATAPLSTAAEVTAEAPVAAPMAGPATVSPSTAPLLRLGLVALARLLPEDVPLVSR